MPLMPNMNGFQLCQRILQLGVNIGVGFMSALEVNIQVATIARFSLSLYSSSLALFRNLAHLFNSEVLSFCTLPKSSFYIGQSTTDHTHIVICKKCICQLLFKQSLLVLNQRQIVVKLYMLILH